MVWFGVQISVVGWGVVCRCFLSIRRCWTWGWKGTPFLVQNKILMLFEKESNHISYDLCLQAVKETGHKFRETILALGGGKAPLEVRLLRTLKLENMWFFLWWKLNEGDSLYAGIRSIQGPWTFSRGPAQAQWPIVVHCCIIMNSQNQSTQPQHIHSIIGVQ